MPPGASIRVVVAGAGLMGRWHAHAARRAGARIVGVVDPDPEAGRRLGVRHRAPTFATLDEALAATRPGAVHVTAPLPAHEPLVSTALAAGAHVLCEKPLAGSLLATERLGSHAAAASRLLVPVHQLPFQDGVRRVLAERERIGRVVRVAISIATAGADGRDRAGRRDVLLEMLPHAVSLLRAFRVGSAAAPLVARLATDDALLLTGEDAGAALEVTLSVVARPTLARLEIWGTGARAHVDLFHGFCVIETGRPSRVTKAAAPFRLGASLLGAAGTNLAARALRREPAYPGLGRLVAAFHAAALGRGPCPIPPDEALEAARVADAARAAFTP